MKKRFGKLITMLLIVVLSVSMLPMDSIAAEAVATENVPAGYVTDEHKTMAYQFINSVTNINGNFDIMGLFDGKWKDTTFDNSGFSVYFKQDAGAAVKVNASGKKEPVKSHPGITIKTDVSFQNYGKLLKISYSVENDSGSPITYSLGSAADIRIGEDDNAAITKLDDSKGFKMVSSEDNDKNMAGEFAQFNFFGRGVPGVTDVSDFWYGDLLDPDVMAFAAESSIIDGSMDAGMGYSWKGQTIEADGTQTYSVLIGVGGAGSEAEGDKSFYSLTVDGSYESVTGEGSYESGTVVTINAGNRSNYSFSGWTSSAGGIFANAGSTITTFTMPDNDVTVTANWKSDSGPTPPDNTIPPDNITPPENSSSSGTQTSRPYQSMTGAITICGEMDKKQKASLTITKENIGNAIAAAYIEANKKGVLVKDISVVINIKTNKKAKQSIINIPKSIQNLLNNNKIVSTAFRIDGNTIRFNNRAMEQITSTAQEDVTITAARISAKKLTGKAKKLIGSRPIYDFQVSCDDGKIINDFGANNVSIAIPYTLRKGEIPEQVHVYSVDEKGIPHRQLSIYDKKQEAAVFIASSNLRFGVGYNKDVPQFRDSKYHWAKEEINYAVSCGFFKGAGGNKFSADAVLSRGMTAAMLGRMADVNTKKYKAVDFTDVAKKAYYAPYVDWAVKQHVMEKTGDKKFDPNKDVTREELAVIMVNYAKEMGYNMPSILKTASFSDSSSINKWAAKETVIMQQAGVFLGRDGNRFDPQGKVTRGEAAAILCRFTKAVIDQKMVQGWTKNDSGHWIYYQDGKKLIGWQTISGTEYYFNVDGTLEAPLKSTN